MRAEIRLPSDRLVQFITFVFTLQVGQGFIRHSELIVHPTLSLSFVSLMAVFYTILATWVFYSRLLHRHPYEDNLLGILRFALDFVIVGVNAYLVFTVELIKKEGNVHPYVIGYVAIFFLYIVSGLLRRMLLRGSSATFLGLILVPFFLFLFLASIYPYVLSVGAAWKSGLNWAFVLLPPIVDFAYRVKRWQGTW